MAAGSPTMSSSHLSDSGYIFLDPDAGVERDDASVSDIESMAISASASVSGFDSELEFESDAGVASDVPYPNAHTHDGSDIWGPIAPCGSAESVAQRNELVASMLAQSTVSASDYDSDSSDGNGGNKSSRTTHKEATPSRSSRHRDTTPSAPEHNPWRGSASPPRRTPNRSLESSLVSVKSEEMELVMPSVELSPSPPSRSVTLHTLPEEDTVSTDVESTSELHREETSSSFPLSIPDTSSQEAALSVHPDFHKEAKRIFLEGFKPALQDAIRYSALRITFHGETSEQVNTEVLQSVLNCLTLSLGPDASYSMRIANPNREDRQVYIIGIVSRNDETRKFISILVDNSMSVEDEDELRIKEIPTLIVLCLAAGKSFNTLPALPALTRCLPIVVSSQSEDSDNPFAPSYMDALQRVRNTIYLPNNFIVPFASMSANVIQNQLAEQFKVYNVINSSMAVEIEQDGEVTTDDTVVDIPVKKISKEPVSGSVTPELDFKPLALLPKCVVTKKVLPSATGLNKRNVFITMVSLLACCGSYLINTSRAELACTFKPALSLFPYFNFTNVCPPAPVQMPSSSTVDAEDPKPAKTLTIDPSPPVLSIDAPPRVQLLDATATHARDLQVTQTTAISIIPSHTTAISVIPTQIKSLLVSKQEVDSNTADFENNAAGDTLTEMAQQLENLLDSMSAFTERVKQRHERAKFNARRLTRFSQGLASRTALRLRKRGDLMVH